MTHAPASRQSSSTSSGTHRRLLLAGVSLVALLAAGPAFASNRLQASTTTAASGSTTGSTSTTGSSSTSTSTSTTSGDLVKAAHSFQAALSAQAAAAKAAMNAASNSVTLSDGTNVTVTDGLSSNGLVVDPRVTFSGTTSTNTGLWDNISAPVQTTSDGKTTVTLTQSSQRAIATWYKFNVGRNTTVYFDQSAGNTSNGNSWTVLNRIDATGTPSVILGTIKAEGTVLVINPNGIVFGAGSQVNVHSLIASAMDINSYAPTSTTTANYGVYDSSGTYTSYSNLTLASASADGDSVYTPAGTYSFSAPVNETSGNKEFLDNGLYLNNGNTTLILSTSANSGTNYGVTVQKGATISTVNNVSGFDNGGYVALVGPSVSNAGLIETSAGEIALASGDTIYLTEPSSSTSAFTVTNYNPTKGSNLEYSPPAVSGITLNDSDGVLYSQRGNITLVGSTVEQNGVAEATTSITRPGSIAITASGTTTFGTDSTTAIVSAENGETIVESSIASGYTAPSISIVTTNLDMVSGSLIVAPSATMTVDSYQAAVDAVAGTASNYTPTGRVLLESGSVIDLGGMEATASVSDYLYTFKVTANDVADTPLAQSLIGQTVTIDLRLSGTRSDGEAWVGSRLFAATGSGYLGNVAYSLDMLLTTGGSLTIGSSGAFTDVITASGSLVNVSGGAIAYTGAMVTTTNVKTAAGAIVNIGSADPFTEIVGLPGTISVTSDRWNVTTTYSNRLTPTTSSYYDSGYTDGLSAGSVSVAAVNPILEGFIEGSTYTGSRQALLSVTSSAASLTTPDDLPTGAALTIALATAYSGGKPNSVVLADDVETSAAMADALTGVSAESGSVSLPTAGGLSTITYSTDLLSSENLGSITIKGAYELSMAAGSSLAVRAGGKITLAGVTEIDGTLTAHGGSITLSGLVPSTDDTTPALSAAVTVGGLLDVSGLWVNDAGLTADAMQGWAWIDGGSVSITTYKNSGGEDTTQSIVLASGSVIDLSSGGYVTIAGKIKTGADGLPSGNGGDLTLQTYAGSWHTDEATSDGKYTYPLAPATATNATVVFDGTIYAAGLNKGGTLSLQVPAISIDGTATAVATDSATGTLILPTSFFTQGFSTYALTSTYGDITVTDNTTLTLKQQNYLLPTGTVLPATGASVRDFASLGTAADGLRQPVDLTLTQQAFGGYQSAAASDPENPAGITIGQGASILADPGAAITLAAAGPVTVLGSIVAHGGSITLSSDDTALSQSAQYGAAQDVWIGADALLDVSGIYVPDPTETAYSTGEVLDGGTISISSSGAIVALAGATFDIAGAGATVQIPTGGSAGLSAYASKQIWSDGGTLTLYSTTSATSATSSLYFAGTIDAAGGSASASGGTLNIGKLVTTTDSSGNVTYATAGYTTIDVAQGGDVTSGLASAGAPATAAQLAALGLTSGTAYLTADTVNAAHLDSAALTGTTIAFAGNVAIAVPDALYLNGNIALSSSAASTVTLSAGYIRWLSGTAAVPAAGSGTLNLDATTQIDLAGVVSASYADTVNLSVSGGDIRFLPASDTDIAGYLSAITYNKADASAYSVSSGALPSAGALIVPGDLTMTAREIYPATDTDFLLMSTGTGGTGGGTIAFRSNGQSTYTPYSAGGAILVDAATILQAGALIAPLGTIQLGYSADQSLPAFLIGSAADTGTGNLYDPVSVTGTDTHLNGVFRSILTALKAATGSADATVTTGSVTLASGSLTSTSANGVSIPYGTTTDGESWTVSGTQISGPPAKLIVLAGNTVVTQSGATIDESGGGDVYATEFVPGTGGSRNILSQYNTVYGSDGTSTRVPLYSDARQIYALVPYYEAKVAAYDTTNGSTVSLGAAVTLTGGNGIAAGTYVLMPASYATLAGAYRVVVASTNTGSTATYSRVSADGSIYATGTLTNAITGAKSSSTALFEIQSSAVWGKYSEIDTTTANSYFADTTYRLARDAGQMIVAATDALTLQATNKFIADTGGRGGEIDITGTNLLVAAGDIRDSLLATGNYAGTIVLDADQVSGLGVESVLLGGYRTSTGSSGVKVKATAEDLTVATDSAHALTGPEILLAANDTGAGLTIADGSVIAASGTVTSSDALVISGDGAFARISAGGPVTVTRSGASLYDGRLTVGAATLSGTSLALDSSGGMTLSGSAALLAKNYDLGARVINVGGGSSGLVLSDAVIAQMAGADSVLLRGLAGITFYDGATLGTSADPIGTLTLDTPVVTAENGTADAVVTATDIVFKNSSGSTGTAAGGSGTLSLDAQGTLTLGAGTKVTSGFGTLNGTAGTEILFSGTGSLDAGSAAVTLEAPYLVVDTGAAQSLTTTGTATILPVTGGALALAGTVYGGSLSLSGGSIADSGTLIAQAGTVTLKATSGDVTLSGDAAILAPGTTVALSDQLEYTPGGTVKLIADVGNITLGSGITIDVSAAGSGYAGAIGLQADKGTVTLGGTFDGAASSNALGGSFVLSANALSGSLPLSSGFTTEFEVALTTGDITIAIGQTLTAATVLLQADGGQVTVNGAIDASGSSGGTIQLFGTSGVDVEGSLQAKATTNGNSGGTVEIGTSGTPVTETIGSTVYTLLNPTYGYEEIATSGQIKIGSAAVINVSGLDSTGAATNTGTVLIRAPLLKDGSVNVSIASGASITGAGTKALEAYVVWSTNDGTTSNSTNTTDGSGNVIAVVASQHFDAIIDPAGWYDASGTLLAGAFTDVSGTTVATWDGTTLTSDDGASTLLSYYLTNDYFTPTSTNTDHQTFYGYVGGTESSGAGTLMGFVQSGLSGSAAQTTATHAGLTLTPGIELRNPSSSINSGNITVATNWNLGAEKSNGTLAYRYNGIAPILTLRAKNHVIMDASITDGFVEKTAIGASVTVPGSSYNDAHQVYNNAEYWVYYYTSLYNMVHIGELGSISSIVEPVKDLSTSDEYYYVYQTYEKKYINYLREIDDNSNITYRSSGQTLSDAASSGSTSALATISYLTQAQAKYDQITTATSAAEKLSLYSEYLSLYGSYVGKFGQWASGLTVATLPVAPYAPPEVSVAAGTVNSATVDNSPSPTTSTKNYSPISSMDLASESSSSSYRIVAGADFASANPLAVDRGSSANVVVDGHTSYTNPQYTASNGLEQTISVGTVVRTGTGSVEIAASGDFDLADSVAPGAVYTAGTAADTSSLDFTAPAVSASVTSNGLVSTPTWASGGGSVTVIVGGDIIGQESGSLDGATNWSEWYYHAIKTSTTTTAFDSTVPNLQQSAAWVNYATYADGIGALGAGNVRLSAGGTIQDIIVSLPQGIIVAGGTSSSSSATEYTYGGGNLSVTAANIVGSAFLVGQGTGIIRVSGSITADSSGNGLDLAVQDGFITVIAGGDVTLGGIYDPAMLANLVSNSKSTTGYSTAYSLSSALPGYVSGSTSTLGTTRSGYFTSYSEDSGIALTSVSGDVTIDKTAVGNALLPYTLEGTSYSTLLAPATLVIDAIGGDITVGPMIDLIPSSSGTLTLLAGGDITSQNYSATYDIATQEYSATYGITMLDGTSSLYVDPLGAATPTTLSSALHADDDGSVLIYAGEDIFGSYNVIKQAKLYAGRDIVNVAFTGQNNRTTDITSVIAGRDIGVKVTGTNSSGNAESGKSTIILYGPGDLLVQAGRNLGPYDFSNSNAAATSGGIFSVGDGSNCTSAICTGVVKSYLPVAGADITILYGVGGGIDYADFINDYVNPTNALAKGFSSLFTVTVDGQTIDLTSDAGWTWFESLSTERQHLLVDKAFSSLLTVVATDYSDSSSPYYKQYARAYEAIATLFPASLGYSDNSSAGGANGASSTVTTGTMRMAHALVETQTGGDINILGPGGSLYVGSNSSDSLSPSQQGILTLQGGSVNIYADQNVMLYQSRVFTEQGGDVDIFSANGDINAGKGQKSKTAYPKLKLVCDADGYCRVSPVGLVSGAGIGALVTVAGQDPNESNVSLTAPHGTVDAGAAGIRVAGNLNIVALRVLNAFNISVGGAATGVPVATAPTVNLGALSASDSAGAASAAASAAAQSSRQTGPRATDLPSIITIEVIGYGGAGAEDQPGQPQDQRRRAGGRQSRYDAGDPIRVVGFGALSPADTASLTDDERRRLAQQVHE